MANKDARPAVVHDGKTVKRALVLGCGYKDVPRGQTYSRLPNAVRDAKDVAKLLNVLSVHSIAQYSYDKDNIVQLVDDDKDPRRRPTRDNILRELSRLVQETSPGDRFFLYFLVPCDYWNHAEDVPLEERMILSSELRTQLLDRLPIGSNNYAVFDACASGRFLDLFHNRCNNIYVPWISLGFRRGKTRWRNVCRRDDCTSSISSIRIYRGKRVNENEVLTVKTSVNVNGKGKSRRISVESRQSSIHRRPNIPLGSREGSTGTVPGMLTERRRYIFEDLDVRQCASPIQTIISCDGFHCDETVTDVVVDGPNLTTIASSGESQKTWDQRGDSFTQVLFLHYALYTRQSYIDSSLHEWSKGKREVSKQTAAPFDPAEQEALDRLELVNFFEPQVGSQRPMVLPQRFDP
ncbi:hypothetical protein C2E23DRAFT_918926 [Lenzites betulinus]|nr:hypothetical protein C2E23DRAFT_918926 [Lenzites betulinus]